MSLKPWVIVLGVACIAAILLAAWLVDRAPKCSDCGWREGHRPDCSVLDRLVDRDHAMETRLLDHMVGEIRAGRMTKDEAMAALDMRRVGR